jgi:hypothetical protein
MPPPLQSVRQRRWSQLRMQVLPALHVAEQRASLLQSRVQLASPAEQSTVQFAWSVQAVRQRAPRPQVIRQVVEPEQAISQVPVVQVKVQLCLLLQVHFEPHSLVPVPVSGAPLSGTLGGAVVAVVVVVGVAVVAADGAPTGASFGMFQS